MTTQSQKALEPGGEMLKGAASIADFLAGLGGKWTRRQVYHAAERRGLPIRHKPGIGLYAFKSELLEALRAPLPPVGGSV